MAAPRPTPSGAKLLKWVAVLPAVQTAGYMLFDGVHALVIGLLLVPGVRAGSAPRGLPG